MITRLKNGSAVGKTEVLVEPSKVSLAVALALKRHDYIKDVNKRVVRGKNYLEILLPKISHVKRISKPSRRVYAGASDLRPVRQGYGHLLLSTPKGVMTGDEARKARLGGELLFEIW